MIISTPQDTERFEKILGNGSDYGINLSYAVQPSPDGLAQAFIIGEDFIGEDPCALILGDNIFYGNDFESLLKDAVRKVECGVSTVFGYYVEDPTRFGVVEFDDNGRAVSIEEKPKCPKSNYAVTGLYFYDKRIVDVAKCIKPSDRGELEITDVNKFYLSDGSLNVSVLDKEFVWLDAGTFKSMFEAIELVKKESEINPVCIPEIVAYENGWIGKGDLISKIERYKKSPYADYLRGYLEDH